MYAIYFVSRGVTLDCGKLFASSLIKLLQHTISAKIGAIPWTGFPYFLSPICMENDITISITEIEDKLAGIDEKIKGLEEERTHLRWFLDKYAKRLGRSQSAAGLPSSKKQVILDGVLKILPQSGDPMKSGDIYEALLESGLDVNKNTFDWLMNTWWKDPNAPIVKHAYGLYGARPVIKPEDLPF